MAVILGDQGVGKSTLLELMLNPVEEICVESDFKAIADDRNSMLWKNFVMVFNEMGHAKTTQIDTVRNAITAPHLTRRIMRTDEVQCGQAECYLHRHSQCR